MKRIGGSHGVEKSTLISIYARLLGSDKGVREDGVLWGGMTKSSFEGDTYCKQADAAVYTNFGVEANTAATNDVAPFSATAAQVNDAFYIGHSTTKFCGIRCEIVTQGDDYTAIWEYYTGAAWASLTNDDNTTAFKAAAGWKSLVFEPPSDWATVAVDSVTAYWIRCRCTVVGGLGYIQPVLDEIDLFLLNAGTGIRVPYSGVLNRATFLPQTESATNNDSIFLIVNATQGTFDTITYTKGEETDVDTSVALTVVKNDHLVILEIQEDGTTEMADLTLILEIQT